MQQRASPTFNHNWGAQLARYNDTPLYCTVQFTVHKIILYICKPEIFVKFAVQKEHQHSSLPQSKNKQDALLYS